MATPLGVYLTTGDHRAGVGDGALVLTGVVLALIQATVLYACLGFESALGIVLPPTGRIAVQMGLFLLLLRLTPLAGFHAAEHQVVNALERGHPLTLDALRREPRVHAACGTNLIALVFGAQLLIPFWGQPGWFLGLGALLLVTWRPLGRIVQTLFTTKRPKVHQLRMAQRAGLDLMRRQQLSPRRRVSRWGRAWSMGILQILSGGLGATLMIEWIRLYGF